MTGDEVEIEVSDRGVLVERRGEEPRTHVLVGRVVHDDDRWPERGRGEQVLNVAEHAGGRVVAVDEHEVDGPALGREPLQEGGQELVAVAGVGRDRRQLARQSVRPGPGPEGNAPPLAALRWPTRGMDYPVETFTDEERALLAPHFTNVDRPVFALVNLPETVKGALFARYSRYQGTLRRLYLEEFVENAAHGVRS
ncbi:MAG TPA: hypothetical protein VF072_07060, partial [Thermoleophilaceae bacterium]